MSKDITAKLKRLETICRWMADTKREYFTVYELAKECGVSKRSILRDIALLKEAGFNFDLMCSQGVYMTSNFSFEKLGLTPQTVATLCIAYEAAKQAGKEFASTCQYIQSLLVPQIAPYEINPILPPDPIILKLQKAIKEKLYIKITVDDKTTYAKPCCLVRTRGNVFLIFVTTKFRRSVWGYFLDRIALKWITDVGFGAKSPRVKDGHFASLGVPKWEINDFIKDLVK